LASRGDTIDKAIALKSDQDVVDRLRARMPDALKELEEIACGNVKRNAAAQLKAIETMLRFSQPLPKVTVEHQGSVGIAVIDPYAEAAGGEEASNSAGLLAPPASQAVVPVAPIRRRPAAQEAK
jgi:hypothetical protein